MRLRFLLPLLAFSACTAESTSPTPVNPPETKLAGQVTFDVSSWGRLLTHWHVRPDGTGEIWKNVAAGNGEGEVRKYHLHMDDAALRHFIAASEPLRQATVSEVPCKRQISDLPYGAISWELPAGKQTYSFDAGCLSPEADAVTEKIKAVQNVINTMATVDAQPYATEKPAAR